MDSDVPQEALAKEQDVLRFLSTPRSTDENDLVELHHHPSIRKIFLKYNTPITSSAPVERLFSYAGTYEIVVCNVYAFLFSGYGIYFILFHLCRYDITTTSAKIDQRSF